MILIVPATADHVLALYGENPPRTLRAMAAVDGDQVLGLAGIYQDAGLDVVFAKVTPELAKDRRAVLAGARKVMAMFGQRVFAICDPDQKTADGFLRHFGFEPLAKGVYVWNR